MAASTIYDIRLRYMLEDRASKGLNTMDKRLRSTGKSAGMLSGGLGRLAAMGVATFGIRAAADALIGFNRRMEDARTNIAGLIMSTTGTDWSTSIGAASSMMGELQGRAAKSTATTMEMVKFMNEVTQPLLGAGLAAKDLAKFTADTVIAAKAFGDEGIAAMDIQQALNQGVQIRDRFARKLLVTVGKTREEFNKMSKGERLDVLKSAVGSKAIQKLGEEQASTLSGVWSTFTDNLQRGIGTAGEGLFGSVKEQLTEMNTWLQNNQDRVKDIGRTVGQYLVSGFKTIKSVISFFVDHADTLVMVAKAWAGLKVGGMLGGALGGAMGQGGGMLQRLGGGLLAKGFDKSGIAVATFGGKLLNMGMGVAKFLGPLGLAAGALKGIYDWWNKEDPSKKKKRLEVQEATSQIVAIKKEITPLLQERLRVRGAGALSPFESSRSKAGVDMPSKGMHDEGFFSAFESFTGGEISTSLVHLDKFKGLGKSTAALDLQMIKNAEAIKAQELKLGSANVAMAEWALAQGLFTDDLRSINQTKLHQLGEQLGYGSKATKDLYAAMGILGDQMKAGGYGWVQDLLNPQRVDDALANVKEVPLTDEGKTGKVNVTIQRIEVKSDDPDRFVFQMQSAVSKLASNPSQGRLAQRMGGR